MSSCIQFSVNNKGCDCLPCFLKAKHAQQQISPASIVIKKEEDAISEKTPTKSGWKGEPQDLLLMSQYLNPAVVKVDENGNLVVPPDVPSPVLYKYKTVMCKSWLLTNSCPYESRCKFAHGESELRQIINIDTDHPKYKTKPCKNFTITGLCPFGSRCLFIHPKCNEQQTHRHPLSETSFSSYNAEKAAKIRRIWEPLPHAADCNFR